MLKGSCGLSTEPYGNTACLAKAMHSLLDKLQRSQWLTKLEQRLVNLPSTKPVCLFEVNNIVSKITMPVFHSIFPCKQYIVRWRILKSLGK